MCVLCVCVTHHQCHIQLLALGGLTLATSIGHGVTPVALDSADLAGRDALGHAACTHTHTHTHTHIIITDIIILSSSDLSFLHDSFIIGCYAWRIAQSPHMTGLLP